jgi:transcriptional regulator with XRE-family HTH domain
MEGDLQRALGANVRRHREALGVSQEAFGDLLGRHRTYVGAIERGERNLSLRTVERLAEALGVPARRLLDPRPASRHSTGSPTASLPRGRGQRRE